MRLHRIRLRFVVWLALTSFVQLDVRRFAMISKYTGCETLFT